MTTREFLAEQRRVAQLPIKEVIAEIAKLHRQLKTGSAPVVGT
jgi:hypothetical protein